MSSAGAPFGRIVVPVVGAAPTDHALRTSTVLARWFDAAVQLVCDEPELTDDLRALAGGLGVRVEEVVGTAALPSDPPGLAVADAELALGLVDDLELPLYVAAERGHRRLVPGPVVVTVTGRKADIRPLALAAVVARHLDEPVILVPGRDHGSGGDGAVERPVETGLDTAVETALHAGLDTALETALKTALEAGARNGLDRGLDSEAAAADARDRLLSMGCQAEIAGSPADDLDPVAVADARGAVAVVAGAAGPEVGDLLRSATGAGIDVLLAPTGRSAPPERDAPRRAGPARQTTTARSGPPGGRIASLDEAECLARIARHTVARVGYIDDDRPVIVPVNYRFEAGEIFIRSLAGGKLGAARRGDLVCFELDGYDEALRTGWSVLAHGRLEVLADPAALARAWSADPHPWVSGDSMNWLRLVPDTLSGREVWPTAIAHPSASPPRSNA